MCWGKISFYTPAIVSLYFIKKKKFINQGRGKQIEVRTKLRCSISKQCYITLIKIKCLINREADNQVVHEPFPIINLYLMLKLFVKIYNIYYISPSFGHCMACFPF